MPRGWPHGCFEEEGQSSRNESVSLSPKNACVMVWTDRSESGRGPCTSCLLIKDFRWQGGALWTATSPSLGVGYGCVCALPVGGQRPSPDLGSADPGRALVGTKAPSSRILFR